jgi:CRP/FNR family transcriptional regulator, dissimilatory nitrate respiration regulator
MKLEKYIEVLSSAELFKGLSTEDIRNLFKSLNYNIGNYSKEDTLFIEDDECKNLSFILEGVIEIQKIDSNGKVMTIAKFGAGEVFGELLIFSDNNKFPMTVMSRTSSVILHVDKASVIKLCQTETRFLYAYLRMISSKAFLLNKKLKEVTLKTIREQIVEFIFNQAKIQNSETVKITMTKKDWADKIGVQRPSLSRELIKMKEEGIIDFNKDEVVILDRETLESYL